MQLEDFMNRTENEIKTNKIKYLYYLEVIYLIKSGNIKTWDTIFWVINHVCSNSSKINVYIVYYITIWKKI